jgi:hypothetical protein
MADLRLSRGTRVLPETARLYDPAVVTGAELVVKVVPAVLCAHARTVNTLLSHTEIDEEPGKALA